MTLMIAGLVLFLGMHSVQLFAPGLKPSIVDKIGANGWKILYSVVSLVGFVVLVKGYAAARVAPDVALLWNPPAWTAHVAALLMLMSFIYLAAAYVPGNAIKARAGHPMLIATKAWALAHLLANGRLVDVVLFASILAWAVVDFIVSRKRDRAAGKTYARGPASRTVITVVVGLVTYVIFAMWLHAMLIGVAPFSPRG